MSNKSLGPDFIGIGAMKAASGWIFRCIELHPEVSEATPKELHFFSKPYNYEKGIKYYYSIFKKHPPGKIKGEYTPAYMSYKHVASRIHEHLPNVKLIACLRNPVDRAYSQYRYNIQEGGRFKIYKNFEETIRKDKDILKRGFYFQQLKPYFKLFPKENILILFFEDIKKDPIKFVQKIYEFLELKDTNFIPSLVNRKSSITGAYITQYKLPVLNFLVYWLNYRLKKDGFFRKLLIKNQFEKLFIKFQQKTRKRITGKNTEVLSIQPLKEKTREYLLNVVYGNEISKLEKLLDKDLSFWK
ncbi:MAG: hypothetical protein EU548_00850 [Promethearchaeota archaeon]|nr:MAG: hypothetical protein EU548_00850 [Candidatus Lokiarchaeota archaeon]